MTSNNHKTTKPLTLLTVALALSAVMGMGSSAQGREWSDFIRLTYTGYQKLDNDYFMEIDSEGHILLIYKVEAMGGDIPPGWYFGKFRLDGSPLIDPFRFISWEDSLWIDKVIQDEEDRLHMFGGQLYPGYRYEAMYMRLNNEGDIIFEPKIIEGMMNPYIEDYSVNESWEFARRSDESFIGVKTFMAQEYLEVYNDIVAYGVFTDECDIDSIKIITTDNEVAAKHYQKICVDENDNAHIVWCHTTGRSNHQIYYARLDENDSLLFTERRIRPLDDNDNLLCHQILSDYNGHLFMSLSEVGTPWRLVVKKTDYNGDDIWNATLRSIDISDNGAVMCYNEESLHIGLKNNHADPDSFGGYIGYMSINPIVGQIDSTYKYIRRSYSSGKPTMRVYQDIIILLTQRVRIENLDQPDDFYIIVGYPDEAGINENIFLPGNSIMVNAKPNPFNSLITLDYRGLIPGLYTLQVYGINGEQIHQRSLNLMNTAILHWGNRYMQGNSVPNGTYFVKLSGNRQEVITPVILQK